MDFARLALTRYLSKQDAMASVSTPSTCTPNSLTSPTCPSSSKAPLPDNFGPSLTVLLLSHSPNTPWQPAPQYFSNGPRLHEFLQELNEKCFSKYECVACERLDR